MLNSFRNRLALALLVAMQAGCAHSKEIVREIETPDALCEKVKVGEFDLSLHGESFEPRINSYLLSCSVAVVISPLSFQSGSHQGDSTIKEGKLKAASFFLSQPLDMTYVNSYGDNVLMSVAASFLPEVWKVDAVNKLINDGIDLSARNNNGDTALDIAIYKNELAVIRALQVNQEKASSDGGM